MAEGTRVLLVEDHEGVRVSVTCMLDACGFIVTPVASSFEALAALQNEEFEVICTDLGLAEMDGSQLVSAIRARGIQTPAVIMSGASQGSIRKAFLGKPQPQAIVGKPIALNDLVNVIEMLAESHEGSSQAVNAA